MRVYVAGALSSKEQVNRNPSQVVVDYIKNMSQMCLAATALRALGFAPFVPALDFLLGFRAGTWEEDDYRDMNMEFLIVCDAVYVVSPSYGARKEVEVAKEHGVPVFTDMEALVAYFKDVE